MAALHKTVALRAIIYLLDNEETQRWARVCMEWCERHGYDLIGITVDNTPDGSKWHDVVRMMADDEVQVCVVPRWDQMPPDRVPRVEVITEDTARDAGGQHRPHIIGA